MTTRENLRVDDNRWRKLCELVATENDPKRLSQLLDQLLKELDARRDANATKIPTNPQTISDIPKSHSTAPQRTRAHGLKQLKQLK